MGGLGNVLAGKVTARLSLASEATTATAASVLTPGLPAASANIILGDGSAANATAALVAGHGVAVIASDAVAVGKKSTRIRKPPQSFIQDAAEEIASQPRKVS